MLLYLVSAEDNDTGETHCHLVEADSYDEAWDRYIDVYPNDTSGNLDIATHSGIIHAEKYTEVYPSPTPLPQSA